MKYIIASDIHGSARWCAELLTAFENDLHHSALQTLNGIIVGHSVHYLFNERPMVAPTIT